MTRKATLKRGTACHHDIIARRAPAARQTTPAGNIHARTVRVATMPMVLDQSIVPRQGPELTSLSQGNLNQRDAISWTYQGRLKVGGVSIISKKNTEDIFVINVHAMALKAGQIVTPPTGGAHANRSSWTVLAGCQTTPRTDPISTAKQSKTCLNLSPWRTYS